MVCGQDPTTPQMRHDTMDQAFINLDLSVAPTDSQRVHLDVLQHLDMDVFLPTTRPEAHQTDSFESYFEDYYDISDSGWPSPTPIDDNLVHNSEQPLCKFSATQISTTTGDDYIRALGPSHNPLNGSYFRFRNTFANPQNSSSKPSAETSSSRSPAEVQSECHIRKEVC